MLKLALAIGLSVNVQGDPLWLYLIAPPGGGKTTILRAFADSPQTMILSRITPKTLVSGQRSDSDPSLLPKMNHNLVVWPEFTEILEMPVWDREELFALLRSAYDGIVHRAYGNGLTRNYDGIHFAMLAGCTPMIHASKKALMGERFMKFEMRHETDPQRLILQAMKNSGKEDAMHAEMRDIAGRFLSQRVDPDRLPAISDTHIVRIAAVAQLIGLLRAQVDREQFGDRDLRYRPFSELGTRLAKQLVKLARMLALVEGKTAVDDAVYADVTRVARDTAIGFNLEVVTAIVDAGGSATRDQIRDAIGLPLTSLAERLSDLMALGVIVKKSGAGPRSLHAKKPSDLWVLADRVIELWNEAQLGARRIKTEFRPPPGGWWPLSRY
jgi:hypothetical protein